MLISFIWFQPLDTFLYKILSGDLSTNFFLGGGGGHFKGTIWFLQ